MCRATECSITFQRRSATRSSGTTRTRWTCRWAGHRSPCRTVGFLGVAVSPDGRYVHVQPARPDRAWTSVSGAESKISAGAGEDDISLTRHGGVVAFATAAALRLSHATDVRTSTCGGLLPGKSGEQVWVPCSGTRLAADTQGRFAYRLVVCGSEEHANVRSRSIRTATSTSTWRQAAVKSCGVGVLQRPTNSPDFRQSGSVACAASRRWRAPELVHAKRASTSRATSCCRPRSVHGAAAGPWTCC